MQAALPDLTIGPDHGLTLTALAAMVPLERFALWGPDACDGLPAAVERLHGAQRMVVETARRIDGAHRDHLRRLLVFLADHAWAVGRVLERHPESLRVPATTPRILARTAEGFAHLSAAAGQLLAAVEALEEAVCGPAAT
jgi:hypothetical protein